MKKSMSSIILILIFLVGFSVLLYPSVSNHWNQKTQSAAIANYEDTLAQHSEEDYAEIFSTAETYNKSLSALSFPLIDCKKLGNYYETLDITGTGIIGYISIEKISVFLPIYHGTSNTVLDKAVGHLEGSNLPIGGEGTHAVLSAHRGLPNAKLFTNVDQLKKGDKFTITVLDRLMTYEVDQILIVVPSDISALEIDADEDYCTLLTCTPYGINSHRLLIRGARCKNDSEKPIIYVANEAIQIDPLLVAPVVAIPMLLILLVHLLIRYRQKD